MSNVIDLNRYVVKKHQEITTYLSNTKFVPKPKFEKLTKKLAHLMRLNAFCVSAESHKATFSNVGTSNRHLSFGVNPLEDFGKSWINLVPPPPITTPTL